MKNYSGNISTPQVAAMICVALIPLFLASTGVAQTAPSAQPLPYSQNFGTTTFTAFPAGVTVLNGLSGAAVSSQALAEASAPTGNATLTAATAAQTSGAAYGYASGGNAQLYIQTSSNTSNGVNQPLVAVDTTGKQNIVLNYEISVISAQPRTVGVVAQYRVGISGSWTSLAASSGSNPFSQAGGTTGPKTTVSATLPIAANNQPVVQIRWAVWRGTESGSSSGIGLDNISVTGDSVSANAPVLTSFDPLTGPVGTAVTIGGSNFAGVTNVAFNGVAASFSNVSDTNISATVPAGALSGPISVASPEGIATSSNSFLVHTLSVVLPASINEGDSGSGELRANFLPTNDIEVVLTSSSTNDLVVETPVTIFAGTTNYFFGISAPSDAIIDGNTNVTVAAAAAGLASAPGTISVVNVDQVKIPLTSFDPNGYTQDFNVLGISTISNALSGTTGVQASLGSSVSTNLNGWFAAKIAGSSSSAVNIVADAGTNSSGAIYNYGSTNAADRSFGTLATGSFTGAFGGLVVNNTAETINSVLITLTGKFWRTSTTLQNSLIFGYGKIDGTTFNNNNFLSVSNASPLPSANVVGPAPVSPAVALDGNNPANQVAISNVAIPVSLAPGETMFFRWQDVDGGGSDAGLAIDNLSLTASTNVPLPVVGSVSIDEFTLSQTAATASSSVVTDSGASLLSRGFVYAPSSVSSNPVIGGSNVVVVTNDPPDVGTFTNTLTGLTAATSYSVRSFVVNGAGTNYSTAVQFATLPVPPSFTDAYIQNFDGFTNMAAVPLGWRALSSSNINTYAGNWNAANSVSAGFYGRTNIPGVLGYLHTSATGILSNTLTLVNNSGATLTNLFVSYVGEVNLTNNTRFPAWTVIVDGQTNASLAYSTGSGANEFKSAEITGLSITNGGNIVIAWWSDRGTNATGSSRMIGLTGVRVATTAPTAPALAVSGTLTNFVTTTGTASPSQSFSVSGSGLIGNVTATAPTNYEVSLDNSVFAASVAIAPVDGVLASTPVYVRIAATAPVGSPAGSVAVFALAAATENVVVSGTVSPAGQTFTTWAQGAPLNSANLLLYAIGGASSPTATNGVASTTALTSSNLSITAVVRTNDTALSTFGYALTNLVTGPWSSNGVTMTPAASQTGVPEGCQIQIFSTPRDTDAAKFLRLQSTLTNQ